MLKSLLEALVQVSIIILPAVFLLKDRSKLNVIRLLIFVICYIVYQITLILPAHIEVFNFIKSSWNWDGKIWSILWGIIAYFLFKSYFIENNFFTLKQNKKSLKATSIAAIGIILLSTIVWYILGKTTFNTETLLFQLTLPGIDEEIMFRGILLGIFMSCLKTKIFILKNPAILLTAILFGFLHALTLNKDYAIRFDLLYFGQTVFAGYVWGWITVKSRSIMFAVVSHNFSNFFGTLSTMIK